MLHDKLLELADLYGWALQAWSVFSNHYHFVAISPEDASSLRVLIRRLHSASAIAVNRGDHTEGRRVWFQYWDTGITYEKSYLARLNYVHQNAVRHGVVPVANQYPWCSAAWFERTADPAFARVVYSFGTDRVNVRDDFDLECGMPPPWQSGSTLPHSKKQIDD